MVAKLKYHFTRFIVLLVALHILDVSPDLDFMHVNTSWADAGKYDDIDSISEFILEKIYGDDNLVTENEGDDQHPSHKELNKIQHAFFNPSWKLVAAQEFVAELSLSLIPRTRNTSFRMEDHSSVDYHPPDLSGSRFL